MDSSLETFGNQSKIISEKSRIKIVVGTWNLEGRIPDTYYLRDFLNGLATRFRGDGADLICVATQQCQRPISHSFILESKKSWEKMLSLCAPGYILVQSLTMNALHTGILVKKGLTTCYTTYMKKIMKAGPCNMLGNKGAISITFNFLGQKLQIINCHLQAHQFQFKRRNQVLLKITDQLVNKDENFEVFICGDLNYRVQMSHKQYHDFVEGRINTQQVMHYSQMLEKDQLKNQEDLVHNFFPNFLQGSINFPPTYKLSQFGPQYDKSRIPGWADRIFHRKGRIKQKEYGCFYHVYGTDHRPVYATYHLKIAPNPTLFEDRYVEVKTSACSLI